MIYFLLILGFIICAIPVLLVFLPVNLTVDSQNNRERLKFNLDIGLLFRAVTIKTNVFLDKIQFTIYLMHYKIVTFPVKYSKKHRKKAQTVDKKERKSIMKSISSIDFKNLADWQQYYFFRKVRIEFFELDAAFGMDSPAKTGYIYAVWIIVNPHLPKKVNIQLNPHYTKSCFYYHLRLSINVIIFYILLDLLKLRKSSKSVKKGR